MSPEIYRKIINQVKKCPSKVVLDVDGDALRQGLKAQPTVIKPNIHELSELVGRELKEMDEIVAAAREINRQGVEIVLVSMGARGILLVSRRARVSCRAARGQSGEHHRSRRFRRGRIYQRFRARRGAEGLPDLCRGGRNGHDAAPGNGALPAKRIFSR